MFRSLCAFVLLIVNSVAHAIVLPTHTQNVRIQMAQSPAEGFYNYDMHLRWHKEPDVSKMGFYAQFYFQFQAATGGYMGLQQDRTEGKKAIFSIWDVAGRQSAIPVASNCVRFGHEGTGTSCILPFAWKAGHEYKLRVWQMGANPARTNPQWGGWVIDYTTGEETLIGVIELKDSEGRVGYGGLNGETVATVEYYGGNGTDNGVPCNQLPYFGVTWNGPFGNNGTALPRSATPVYNTGIGTACTSNVNTSANAPFSLTSEAGGTVHAATPAGASLWARFPYDTYAETDCLYNWAETQFSSIFDQSAFRQRRISQSLFGFYLRDYRSNGNGYALIADTTTGQLMAGMPGGDMTNLGSLASLKKQARCIP